MALPRSQQGSATLPSARGSVPCCCPSLGSPPVFLSPVPVPFCSPDSARSPLEPGFWLGEILGLPTGTQRSRLAEEGLFPLLPRWKCSRKKSTEPPDCVLGGGENPSQNTKKRGKRAVGLLRGTSWGTRCHLGLPACMLPHGQTPGERGGISTSPPCSLAAPSPPSLPKIDAFRAPQLHL